MEPRLGGRRPAWALPVSALLVEGKLRATAWLGRRPPPPGVDRAPAKPETRRPHGLASVSVLHLLATREVARKGSFEARPRSSRRGASVPRRVPEGGTKDALLAVPGGTSDAALQVPRSRGGDQAAHRPSGRGQAPWVRSDSAGAVGLQARWPSCGPDLRVPVAELSVAPVPPAAGTRCAPAPPAGKPELGEELREAAAGGVRGAEGACRAGTLARTTGSPTRLGVSRPSERGARKNSSSRLGEDHCTASGYRVGWTANSRQRDALLVEPHHITRRLSAATRARRCTLGR
jgi:hypothetical protein